MKKLKGFTLLELIVVMAIFSMIAVGALAIVQPAMRLFTSTSQQENINACTDNMKRYIEDNLRYADKLVNCVGFEKLEDIYVTDTYNYVYYDEMSKEKKTEEKTGVSVLGYFRDVYYPYVNSDSGIEYDNVYIMEIDNGTTSAPVGRVRIYKANLSDGSYVLDSELNTEFYNDYSYNINFGVINDDKYSGMNTAKDEMYIDIFEKDGSSFEDFGVKLESGHDVTSALYLMNIHGLKTNVTIGVDESSIPVVNSGVTKLTTVVNNDESTYCSKYYFIYTVPEIIIP